MAPCQPAKCPPGSQRGETAHPSHERPHVVLHAQGKGKEPEQRVFPKEGKPRADARKKTDHAGVGGQRWRKVAEGRGTEEAHYGKGGKGQRGKGKPHPPRGPRERGEEHPKRRHEQWENHGVLLAQQGGKPQEECNRNSPPPRTGGDRKGGGKGE